MEVEVKLRLKRDGHDALVTLLKDNQTHLYHQENYFFDGAAKELSTNKMVLRVRFYNDTEKALVTLKGKSVVVDGIGRASETEDAVDPSSAREFLTRPAALLQADLPVIKKLRESVDVEDLVFLGGFKNVRKVINWQGETLEVDETQYEWGTIYEVECETTNPESVRDRLAAFLNENGIDYEYKQTTKFAHFITRTLE